MTMNGGSTDRQAPRNRVDGCVCLPRAANTQREEVARLLCQVVERDSLVVNGEVSVRGSEGGPTGIKSYLV